jgi:ubiquinone/menaquinone biosynthesis C-methylase UbiE
MHPIEDINFWKDRINRAKKEKMQYSVYLANDTTWNNIEAKHKEIAQKTCKGKVLDAGCGYGRMSQWFDDYLGIDFSPDFIEWAKELYPDKKFEVADLLDLPYKDKEFDWAVCGSVRGMIIGNLGKETWQKMELELKRVAKKILILEYSSPDKYEIL